MKREFIKFSKMKNENRWLIINEEEDDCYGQIYYYPKWKKFVVEFNPSGIIWDDICLEKLFEFVAFRNRKLKKNKGKTQDSQG